MPWFTVGRGWLIRVVGAGWTLIATSLLLAMTDRMPPHTLKRGFSVQGFCWGFLAFVGG